MIEVWKDINGYQGLYQVSDLGNIKRIARARGTNVGYIFTPSPDTKGYYRTRLTDAKGIAKTVKVHRIVAQAFIANPNNLPQVNHKDAVKTNNCADNLEWCNNAENISHAKTNGLMRNGMKGKFGKDHNRSIPIKLKNILTKEVKEFAGINEAARQIDSNAAAIWRVRSGQYKHTKNWTFL